MSHSHSGSARKITHGGDARAALQWFLDRCDHDTRRWFAIDNPRAYRAAFGGFPEELTRAAFGEVHTLEDRAPTCIGPRR